MKLDLTKPMQTRDGRKVRFLGNIDNKLYPLVFAISDKKCNAEEYVENYTYEGKSYVNDDDDNYDVIINVPEKITRYSVYFKVDSEWSYCGECETEEEAEKIVCAGGTNKKIVKVEFEE